MLGRMPYSYQIVGASGSSIQVSVLDSDGVLHQMPDSTGALSDTTTITLPSFESSIVAAVDQIMLDRIVEIQISEAGGPSQLIAAMVTQEMQRTP
jgi:hypothetical protein